MNRTIQNRTDFLIGVISDTHGLLRPEAVRALQGVHLIIHAGDIGRASILDELDSIAPVVAVRGNMDRDGWAYKLPLTETLELRDRLIYVVHDIGRIDIDPAAASVSAVISGHSHRPSVKRENGVLYVNPGSAGPRRFTLPATVALMKIRKNSIDAGLVKLGG